MAIPARLDDHIQKRMGKTVSVSGTTATFPTQTFDHHWLESLLRSAAIEGYAVSLEAGVLTLKPKS